MTKVGILAVEQAATTYSAIVSQLDMNLFALDLVSTCLCGVWYRGQSVREGEEEDLGETEDSLCVANQYPRKIDTEGALFTRTLVRSSFVGSVRCPGYLHIWKNG